MVFGTLAVIAAVMMLIPRSYGQDELTEDKVVFNKGLAVVIGIVLGFTIGLVGQGGAFILIPVMLYVLKIPLRVALGSTLAIGLFSSSAGMIGKVATGQVPFLMALPLLAGRHSRGTVGQHRREENENAVSQMAACSADHGDRGQGLERYCSIKIYSPGNAESGDKRYAKRMRIAE